jgi:esterase/lipase superfamily enzyme
MGELCHFLGRDFVCGIFSWPAGGHRGILFGYDVDRESAEYAVEDLVKMIRIVGQTPGVERIHLIAHSRGTDTVASALAELSVEAYTLQSSPDREFHIGNVVLVAPDLDGDVALTKIFKVFSDPGSGGSTRRHSAPTRSKRLPCCARSTSSRSVGQPTSSAIATSFPIRR